MSRRRRDLDRMIERFQGYDREDWGGVDELMKELEKLTPIEAAYVGSEIHWFEFTEALAEEV